MCFVRRTTLVEKLSRYIILFSLFFLFFIREVNFEEEDELSESHQDKQIPSYPGSPSSLCFSSESITSDDDTEPDPDCKFKQAIDYLSKENDLLDAAEIGDVNMLEQILNKVGTNIHQLDQLGRNALHLAVCSGCKQSIVLLLDAGVNPCVKDNVGMTPLSLCLMRRPSLAVTNLLFDHGARVLPRASVMDTGLFLQFVMMCIPTREEEMILRLLVEKGAKVNDPDAPGGRQALHFAAMSNNCRLISILVSLGANLYETNNRDETPREFAMAFNCKEACILLENLEALCTLNSSETSNLSLD